MIHKNVKKKIEKLIEELKGDAKDYLELENENAYFDHKDAIRSLEIIIK